MKSSILISDLFEACRAGNQVSRDYDPQKWLAYEYSTDEVAGTVLFCGPEQNAPELRIALGQTGWHRIYLGIHYGMVAFPLESRIQIAGQRLHPFILRARLSGENWRDMIEPELPSRRQAGYYTPAEEAPGWREVSWDVVDEVHWRAADLDGRDLLISPHREINHEWAAAALAFVRLEPMDENDMADVERERPRSDTRRMFGKHDGSHPPLDEQETRKWLEPLRDSDFEIIAWGASFTDQTFYPSHVGHQQSDPWHVLSLANKRPLPADGFDMLKCAADVCHEMGIEILGSMRPGGGRFPPSHLTQTGRSFFYDHPEFWCVSETGEPVGHLSLAFPEVRRLQIDVMREYFDGRDLDGVHYYFNRCFPFVLYEEPVVRDFQARHDEDPRRLPFEDERWLEHRCGYITTFMRELRAMVDEIGRAKGRHLKVCPTIVNSIENCWINGYDIATWIEEGLVDGLLVHPCFSGIRTDGDDRVTPETIKPISDLAAPRGVKVWADLYPRYKPAEHFRQQALSFYDAGIHGVGYHDYYVRCQRKSEWSMIRMLGHREELKGWRDKALSFSRTHRLKSICGMSNDPRYWTHTNG